MDHCLLQRNFCFDHHCYHKHCGLRCWHADFWPWFQQETLTRISCNFGLQVTGFTIIFFLTISPKVIKSPSVAYSCYSYPFIHILVRPEHPNPPHNSSAFDVGFSLSFSVFKQSISVVFFFFSSVYC